MEMLITDHAQRAHQRLKAILPVRTHVAKPPPEPPRQSFRGGRSQTEYLLERVRVLKGEGLTLEEMAKRLGVTERTVSNYKKRLRG